MGLFSLRRYWRVLFFDFVDDFTYLDTVVFAIISTFMIGTVHSCMNWVICIGTSR